MTAAEPKAETAPPDVGHTVKSKKRKRSLAAIAEVDSSNVVLLWQRMMEQKKSKKSKPNAGVVTRRKLDKQAGSSRTVSRDEPERNAALEGQAGKGSFKKTKRKHRTKRKLVHREKLSAEAVDKNDAWDGIDDDQESIKAEEKAEGDKNSQPPSGRSKKNDKMTKADQKIKSDWGSIGAVGAAAAGHAQTAAQQLPKAPTSNAPKLTPLQTLMREKLLSARFRYLNEMLYTRPSSEALSLFSDSPDMFAEYHEGFRRQVALWPENPVDGYIADLKARGRVCAPSKLGQSSGGDNESSSRQIQRANGIGTLPLPRNMKTGICTIVDLGCGDAVLALALQQGNQARKLRVAINSFDLHSPHPLVTKADMANLPLADGSVDVAIFCLALMGTNWVDFVEEAYRVLRWKGELWVAEIQSRFAGSGRAQQRRRQVHDSVGTGKKPGAEAAKKGADGRERMALAVEVDGVEDRKAETDVSAFVDTLRRRGFVLQAMNLSNKMFVKMDFVKGAPPTKGKCVTLDDKGAAKGGCKPKRKKLADEEENDAMGNEATILKPCRYRLR